MVDPAQNPRVLFVDQSAQLGGAELSLFDLLRRRAGNQDVLLFQEGPFADLLRTSAIDVAVLPVAAQVARVRKGEGLLGRLSTAGSVASTVRRLRQFVAPYDVIYANTPKAFVLTALANCWSRRPMVYHLRDIISAEHFSSGNRQLLVRLANRFAGKVIANSHATAKAFVEAGGDGSRVVVIPNGFDVAPFTSAQAHRQECRSRLRQELGVDAEAKLLAVVGRLAEWKGQHVAIEALRRIPNAHLLMVGDALFGEQEYARRLQRQAEALGLSPRVHFLGFRHDAIEIMQGADALLHTSIAPEPFGRVLVEGMLSRCPVIATRGGGVSEIVTDGVTGWLVEPGSATSLASAVRSVLDDPLAAKILTEMAHHAAVDRYRIGPVVARFEAVIAEVAASRAPVGV